MKNAVATLILFSLSFFVFADADTADLASFTADVQNILDLPEDQIDIGTAALTLAKEIYPDINVKYYSEKIDFLVTNARALTQHQSKQDPETQIRALNTYLYQIAKFHYDPSPQSKTKQEDFFLPNILDTGYGNCVTMPMLYMAVAQRLGYPIHIVGAPEHFFLKYTGAGLQYPNIEATTGGGYASDAKYTYDFNISKRGIESGAYLHPMTNKEFLGILLMQNAIVFAKQLETDRSIAYLKKAMELNPNEPLFYRNIAYRYMTKAKHAKTASEAQRYANLVGYNIAKSDDLGFVSDPDANTRRKQ